MKLKMRYCGLAAILAVVLFSISVGYFLNSGQAAYTPRNPVIASWDVSTDIPKNVTANGTWGTSRNLDYAPGVILAQTAALANDAIRWSVEFPDTSPHTLYIRGSTADNRGIATISIDGINQSTIDQYSPNLVHNVILSAQITPARVGKNAMQFWVANKNSSSSSYFLAIHEWWII